MMFNNQLTAKELYTTNPSQFLQRPGVRSDQEDSAFNSSQTTMSQLSNSQMMSSQMENSQSSSFDMLSQMMSQQQGFSQQTENTNNPQRFYMKYMSKAPLFSKEPEKNPLPRKRSYQEQLDSNKQKAKERDDRDLVNTFVNLVKECTDEVKSAATQIRKNVDKNISESASQFDRLIQKINEDLKTYHNTLTNAVKTREEQQAALEKLQQHISAKDAKIEVIELQLEAAKQQRDERVVNSLLEAYTEQQKENREQITRMHEEQQAFCKTEINKLVQKDQEKYLLERDVAGSSNQYTVVQDELRPPRSAIGVDGRPCSWQGMPQLEQHGFPSRPANRYQEDPSYLNKMHQATKMSHQNDVSNIAMANPGHASLSYQGNAISFPRESDRWSVPLGFQNEQQHMQSVNQYQSGYSFNQATANQQMRSFAQDIPSFGQDARPSQYTTQKNACSIRPSMVSPTSSFNMPMQWSGNRLKPSPVAAVAPQVKPKETVSASHTTQSQDSQENDQHVERETPSVSAPQRKRGRKRYQVAVKTKRQSARVKAKQNMSSLARENEVSDQENMPQNGQNGRRKNQDAAKPGMVSPGSELGNEDVYDYREPENKTVAHNKKQPHATQTIRYLEENSLVGGIHRNVANAKKQSRKRSHSRQISEVSCHVPQQVHKTNTVQPLPKVANKNEYEYPKAVKKTNRSVKTEVERCKQTSKDGHKISAHNSSQDDIFSQKRVKSYSRSKDTKRGSLDMLPSKTHTVTAPRDKKLNPRDEISEGEANYDSQLPDADTSQEQVSQDLINDDKQGCSDEQISKQAGRINVQRKSDKHNRKHYKNASQMKQPRGSKLDSMQCFSDQNDDSSEDLTFSLKLPDSPSCKTSSSHHSKKAKQMEEQVVPVGKTLDILSTPNIHVQLPEDQDSDNESVCTVYSLTSGRKISRQLERKRRLSRYSGSSAAMMEITNSLRLQRHKIRRVSSHR